MRVADCSVTRTYLSQLNEAKYNYMSTQAEIFTGNRFTKLSDDTSSGIRVLNKRFDMYKAEVHRDNVQAVSDELELAEDSLMAIEDILARASELTLKGLNITNSEDADVIADEIASLKDQILLYLNTSYGDKYTFGGSNSSGKAPFDINDDGKLTYNGVLVDDVLKDSDGNYYYLDENDNRCEIPFNGDIFVDVGLGLTLTEDQAVNNSAAIKISFSGLDILGFGTNADGETNNLFNILDQLEESIRAVDVERTSELHSLLQDRTDSFLTHITDIGSKTKYLDNILSRLNSSVDMYKIGVDNLMGTDEEEAISRLAMDEFVLQAVMQLGSRVIPNTLMDFIR